MPLEEFTPLSLEMDQTVRVRNPYWHVRVHREQDRLILRRRQGSARVDLSQYLI